VASCLKRKTHKCVQNIKLSASTAAYSDISQYETVERVQVLVSELTSINHEKFASLYLNGQIME